MGKLWCFNNNNKGTYASGADAVPPEPFSNIYGEENHEIPSDQQYSWKEEVQPLTNGEEFNTGLTTTDDLYRSDDLYDKWAVEHDQAESRHFRGETIPREKVEIPQAEPVQNFFEPFYELPEVGRRGNWQNWDATANKVDSNHPRLQWRSANRQYAQP